MCGNCSNGEPCHHVDGTCPHGCDAGMYGDKCDKGNMRIKFSFINIKFFIFKPFSTQNPNCNFHNTLTFKYQFDNMDLNETLSRQVFQYIQWHNDMLFAVLMHIHQDPWSITMRWRNHIKQVIYFKSSFVW